MQKGRKNAQNVSKLICKVKTWLNDPIYLW